MGKKVFTGWHKSSYSAQGSCVEVAFWPDEDTVSVRNSRDSAGASLHFTNAEWDAFLAGVRDGQFDR